MLIRSLKRVALVLGLSCLILSLPVKAQIVWLEEPLNNGMIAPGSEFPVNVNVSFGQASQLGTYGIYIAFDPTLLEFVRVESGNDLEFVAPWTSENIGMTSYFISVGDQNADYFGSCQRITDSTLSKVWFRLKPGAPLGQGTDLTILVNSYSPRLRTCPPDAGYTAITQDITIYAGPYEETTYGLEQYLDVDADWMFSEGDVDFLGELVFRSRLNVSDPRQVRMGGIQMDFRGNARPDVYDLGSADAVARPTRFVRSGEDGICNSTASSSDIQEIPVGQGSSYAIGILPGPNNVINTTPGGDDTLTGMVITTGANGISETGKAGDDVQAIAQGKSEPNQICVSPGPDGKLSTTLVGDDAILERPKETADILANDYITPGRPYAVKLVYPPVSPWYLPKEQDLPVLVRVEDEFGNPKSGISPQFTVVSGSGRFKRNGMLYPTITGQPSDKFLALGAAPDGAVGGMLSIPALFDTTVIQVVVNPDPLKGLGAPLTTNLTVMTPFIAETIPFEATGLTFGTQFMGAPMEVLFQVVDNMYLPLSGYADRLKILTSRNLANGGIISLSGERGKSYYFNNFSNFHPRPTEGSTIDPMAGGWFGSAALQGYTYGPTNLDVPNMIPDTGHTKLSFQWKYHEGTGNWDDSKMVLFYLNQYGHNRYIKTFLGQEMLEVANDRWLWEDISLTNYYLINGTTLRLYIAFLVQPGDFFWVDNVSVTAFPAIFHAQFTEKPAGSHPYCYQQTNACVDFPNYINTGSNGKLETVVKFDEFEEPLDLYYTNQGPYSGWPFMPAIWPGIDKEFSTAPGGNDQYGVDEFGAEVINTGADGICDTMTDDNDFQVIPFGQGEPFSRGIWPGSDQVLDTTELSGDDERINYYADAPAVAIREGNGAECPPGFASPCRYVFLGRITNVPGQVRDYMVERDIKLGLYKYVYLSFWTKSVGMADPEQTTPRQDFACELSDDGGKTWVTVWDFDGVDHDWTRHEIKLHNDPRFTLTDNFIVRWRASADEYEGYDAAYIADLMVTVSPGEPDVQLGPIRPLGNGQYAGTLVSYLQNPAYQFAAVYVPDLINPLTDKYPKLLSGLQSSNIYSLFIDPHTVKIVPENFKVKACERINYQIIGKQLGHSAYTDLTPYYRLDIRGPARMVAPGVIQAECFTGLDRLVPLIVRAKPLVPGLEDPTGGGGGVQTGLISGKIFLPNLQGASTASIEVVIPGSGSIYGIANSTGNYIFGAVPTGTNYTVKSLKTGYSLNYKAAVSVTAGTNTTINIILKSGADCDGDGTLDSADIDDDADGTTDTMETVKGTQKCKLDSDEDGYGDGAEPFPADGTEWMDSDNDGIGDNDETDDDDEGLSDTEESTLGVDGFITDGQEPDTDHDGITDYNEYLQSKDPTVADPGQPDTDSDGVFNSQEQGGGTCGVSWNKVNTKSNDNDSDTDDDGLNDYNEVYSYNTNPSCHDTDLDGLHDSLEGSTATAKPCPYSNNPDSDGDGLCDGNTAVMDGSTVVCMDGEDLDADKVVDAGETDPCNPDSDGDMMPDGWEKTYSLNPLVNDAALDPDGDTLNNLTEYINNANPNNVDTDGDGINDNVELANELNPAVPDWGNIGVSSDPTAAKVYLDGTQVYRGRYLGLSGTVGVPLSVGTLKNEKHTITIVGANYFVYQTIVDVTLGQSYTVNPTLAYRKLEVFTTSAPVMAGGHTVETAAGYAAPHAVDFDKNGTIDLFMGTGNGLIYYYANSSGSGLSLAAGVTVQAASTTLDAGERAKPFVVDWNNDNKLDLLVGNSLGEVWYYSGNGGISFSAGAQIVVGGDTLTVPEGNAAPAVADWNDDDKKDLIVGAGDGYLYLYLNVGTDAAPVFDSGASIPDIDGNPISAGTFATPIVYDVIRHGYLALGFGGGDGQIGGCGYDTSDFGYHCTYPFLSKTNSDVTDYIDAGDYAAASFADINGDRQMDLFLGNSAGLVVYYQSSHLTGDLDRSTKVDAGDWILVKQSMGLCKGNGGYNPGADLNGDNCVTAADLTVLVGNFGKTY